MLSFEGNCQMKPLKKSCFVLSAVLAIPVQATEQHIDAAADCAAQMFVMTATGRSVEGLDKYFEEQSRLIKMMLGLYMQGQTEGKVTNGMVSKIREAKLRSYESNNISALTIDSLSNCIGWTFALVQTLQKHQGASVQKLQASLLNGPKPDSRIDYPFDDATQLPNWISIAKENWRESGYPTPGKIRDKLAR